jgi:nucleoside-diphosphate-sugar epimerase
MRILVTGATGYIGGAVAEAAARTGHAAYGLAHDDAAAASIRARGWPAVSCDLRDVRALEAAASGFDAVVHAANTGGADAAEVDTAATRALLRGLAGHRGTLLYTSGVWVLGAGRGDEGSLPSPTALVSWRAALEQDVLRASGVNGIVVRPGIVYGRGAGIPGMLSRGELPLIAPGTQRWPMVHVDDLARLYVLALAAPAGSVLHGITTTFSMSDLARLATAATGAAIETVGLDTARAQFGTFADALSLDQDIGAGATRALVGWGAEAPGVVEEFLSGSYTRAVIRAA